MTNAPASILSQMNAGFPPVYAYYLTLLTIVCHLLSVQSL